MSKSGNPKLSALLTLYEADRNDPEGQRGFRWVVTVLKNSHGNIDATAQKIGVQRQAVYRWIQRFPELRDEWDRIRYERREDLKRTGGAVG